MEFDSKNRKTPIPSDLKASEEKFLDYKNQTQTAMSEFLSKDIENVENLIDFAKELADYHKECNKIVEETVGHLLEKYK